MNEKRIAHLLKSALNFIYAGENERPVRVLNFRDKARGGLGLIEPEIKAKALLGRNMYKQWLNGKRTEDIYGNIDILRALIRINNREITTKQIYDILIKDIREIGIKWRHVWKNLISVRGINAEVKEFAWKL